ncbi:MAG: hypothetical protein ACK4R6_07005 [Spirosomataceae bacterium]
MQYKDFDWLKSVFQTAHWLSLDVVLGAISLHLAFSKLPLGSPAVWTTQTSLLALSVWAIYLLDRLLDNRKPEENQTKRHIFHLRYQFNLSLLFLLIVSICLFLVFTLPAQILYFGICMLLSVAVYFGLVHAYITHKKSLFWVKTIGISVIYPFAVVGSIFVQQSSINLSSWLAALFVGFISFQNLLLFAYFENEQASGFGKIIRYITFLLVFTWIFLFYGAQTYPSFLTGILAGISVIYSLLPVFYKQLIKNENYRWIIDSLLITSILSLIF